MAECKNTDGGGNKVSGAFPNRNNATSGNTGLQINFDSINNPVFDINAMLPMVKEYTTLNNALNQLIGYEVVWFRAVPQIRSQDVIFQEWTLFNVDDTPKCLKVVLPDGNFPDSKYNYDLFGLEYEVPLEIHIDKGYWEYIVGGGTAPQKGDIVYFSMPNKLYEVVSSYLFRGFMEQETTWKVNLKKYQPKASRKEGDALKETIDKYTVSEEEIFGEKLDSDIGKLVDKKQMSPFNSTEKDQYKTMDKDLQIIPSNLDIYGVLVAETYYDLNTSSVFNAVTYKGTDIIKKTDDRCITAWTMIDPGVVEEYEIQKIEEDLSATSPANYKLTIKTRNKGFQIGDNVEIWRPGSINFYAKIISDTQTNNNEYYIQIEQPVIDHLNSIKSNWVSLKNYKMRQINPVSILDGINETETTGFKVTIHANQYIRVRYGSQIHIAVIDEKLLEKEWYGIVVNIGNTWGQYNVHVYRQHPSDSTTKLQSIFYETLSFTPEETTVDYYSINKSPSFLTNIRLYSYTMEEEKQIGDLLRYFVKDGDQLIIGDNVNRKFRAPYTGQQK
jgi:hypothetical protein